MNHCAARFAETNLDIQAGFFSWEIQVHGNPRETALLFRHLLENAYEAVDPRNPAITIQTSPEPGTPKFVLVEIFNTGPCRKESKRKPFSPLSSPPRPWARGWVCPLPGWRPRKSGAACISNLRPKEA